VLCIPPEKQKCTSASTAEVIHASPLQNEKPRWVYDLQLYFSGSFTARLGLVLGNCGKCSAWCLRLAEASKGFRIFNGSLKITEFSK
jgi:hypothetical protein